MPLDDARRLVSGYVDHYNNVRLNSATGYITPKDTLACFPHVGGAAAGNPRGARPEVGCGPETTADSSPASRLTYRSRPVGRGSAGDGSVQSHIAAGAEAQVPVCRPTTRRWTKIAAAGGALLSCRESSGHTRRSMRRSQPDLPSGFSVLNNRPHPFTGACTPASRSAHQKGAEVCQPCGAANNPSPTMSMSSDEAQNRHAAAPSFSPPLQARGFTSGCSRSPWLVKMRTCRRFVTNAKLHCNSTKKRLAKPIRK